jgi:hypothetical protein
MLLAEDTVDTFHRWDERNPAWTETFWFGAWNPQAATSVYVYHWFRPVLGIYGGGCLIWDATEFLPWDIPAFYYDVNRPISGTIDLRSLDLDSGATLRAVVPGEQYEVGFARNDVRVQLRFYGLTAAEVTSSKGMTEFFAGHIDQAGRYTGQVEFAGRKIEIDCCGIRDRSWGPRVITDDIRMNYCHGQSERLAFVAYTTPDGTRDKLFRGDLTLDGRKHDLVGGTRRTQYRNGVLQSIDIELEDREGRRITGRGVPLNRLAYVPFPGLITWLHLVRWEIGSEVIYGEEQDVWSLPLWRARDRSARA